MDWENARRVREPVAWILLVLTAIGLVLGSWTLLNGRGPLIPPFPGGGIPFYLRAASAVPDFIDIETVLLPVFAVLLVTVAGGAAERAVQVTQIAIALQSVALGLGLISLAGTSGHENAWFYISQAVSVGLAVAGLILTVAIQRSGALRGVGPDVAAARARTHRQPGHGRRSR